MTNRFFNILNKIKILTGLTKGIGYVTIGMGGGSAIISLLWITLASIMTIDEYGEINYLLTISTFGIIFSLFGLRLTMLTYVPKGIKELKNQINSFILISTISIALLSLILFQSISISILIICLVFFSMSTTECLVYKKYKEFAMILIGARCSQAVSIFVFYYIGGIEFALIGYGLGSIPFSYKYFLSLRFFKFRFNELRSRIRFIVHSFSVQLSSHIQWYDKLLVAPLLGFFILGQYQIGINFLMLVSLIPQILFEYLLSQNASGFSQNRIRYTGMIFTIILVIILWIFVPFILTNFFPKYVETTLSTQIILLGAIPLSITAGITAKLLGLGLSKYVFYGAILFVGVETVFILTLGLTYLTLGLAISMVLSISIQTSYLLLIERQVIRKILHKSKEE